jgi:hypothetical protein
MSSAHSFATRFGGSPHVTARSTPPEDGRRRDHQHFHLLRAPAVTARRRSRRRSDGSGPNCRRRTFRPTGFDAKDSGLFDAAVQLFEQDRHVMWNVRSHRWRIYRDPELGRCSKLNMVRNNMRSPKRASCDRVIRMAQPMGPLPDHRKAASDNTTTTAVPAHNAGSRRGNHSLTPRLGRATSAP